MVIIIEESEKRDMAMPPVEAIPSGTPPRPKSERHLVGGHDLPVKAQYVSWNSDPGPSSSTLIQLQVEPFEDEDRPFSPPPEYALVINAPLPGRNPQLTVANPSLDAAPLRAPRLTHASQSSQSLPAPQETPSLDAAAVSSESRLSSLSTELSSAPQSPPTPDEAPELLLPLPPPPLGRRPAKVQKSSSFHKQPQLPPLPFPASKKESMQRAKEVLLGFLRDLAAWPHPWKLPSLGSVLQGCEKACTLYSLSLSALLQEQSIEGYSLLYWVAVGHKPGSISPPLDAASPLDESQKEDNVRTFFQFGAPLSATAKTEVRLACLQNGSDALFQCLRSFLSSSPISGKEAMLLGVSSAQSVKNQDVSWDDDIQVWYPADDSDAFTVRFRVSMFQRRMKVVEHVDVEFLAAGRLWLLKFIVATKENARTRPPARVGSWIVVLSLLEHSPPTPLCARLVFEAASSSLPGSPGSVQGQDGRPVSVLSGKDVVEHCMPLQTIHPPLMPDRPNRYAWARFEQGAFLDSFQNQNGQPYISADGHLHARLEARLVKSDSSCIIC